MADHRVVQENDVLDGAELKRRWVAIAASMEAMGSEAGKLLGALNPRDMPTEVLRNIEAATRPFTAAIGTFMNECRGFQDYVRRFDEAVAERERAARYDECFAKPLVGKAVN